MTTELQLVNNALSKIAQPPITALADDVERARLATRLWATVRDATLGDYDWNFALKRAVLSQNTQSITSITRVTTTATATKTAHGYATNDFIRISGANEAPYNGLFQITVTSSSVFTYVMASDPGGSATGTLLAAPGPAFEFSYQYSLPSDCVRVVKNNDNTAKWKVEGRYLLTDSASAVKILYVFKETTVDNFDSSFVEAMATRLAAEMAIPLTGNANVSAGMWQLYANKIKETRSNDLREESAYTQDNDTLTSVR